jgi:hypothetical protein
VRPASSNSVGTLGIAASHHFDESLKLTVAYEYSMTGVVTGASDPRDNLFTLQMQGRF